MICNGGFPSSVQKVKEKNSEKLTNLNLKNNSSKYNTLLLQVAFL